MTVREFEQAVHDTEGIFIRIRAPLEELVDPFTYENRAIDTRNVAWWLNNRIRPLLRNFEASLIDGYFREPHGGTLLRNLRQSYERN